MGALLLVAPAAAEDEEDDEEDGEDEDEAEAVAEAAFTPFMAATTLSCVSVSMSKKVSKRSPSTYPFGAGSGAPGKRLLNVLSR